MSSIIKCLDGTDVMVDDEDYLSLVSYDWRIDSYGYAFRNEYGKYTGTRIVLMHRAILGLEFGDPRLGDHRNGIRTDNRRLNLRACTPAQNSQNSKLSKRNTSGYKGVQWMKAKKKWQAKICANRKQKHLGLFDTAEAAHAAYCAAARELHGEFANFGAGPASENDDKKMLRPEILCG